MLIKDKWYSKSSLFLSTFPSAPNRVLNTNSTISPDKLSQEQRRALENTISSILHHSNICSARTLDRSLIKNLDIQHMAPTGTERQPTALKQSLEAGMRTTLMWLWLTLQCRALWGQARRELECAVPAAWAYGYWEEQNSLEWDSTNKPGESTGN